MEKKNPFVTTVGFKKDDPDHIYVAQLLNSMGRGKAQYIVKAVMLYQDMQESGEAVHTGSTYDYERIRKVVLQVIEERESETGILIKKVPLEEIPKEELKPKKEDVFTSLDEDALSGIMASLAAFQQQ